MIPDGYKEAFAPATLLLVSGQLREGATPDPGRHPSGQSIVKIVVQEAVSPCPPHRRNGQAVHLRPVRRVRVGSCVPAQTRRTPRALKTATRDQAGSGVPSAGTGRGA
jgi:hypothetical protein